MGKIITQHQELILSELGKDLFTSNRFYFTGGTALSYYYLHHRYSEDLDFFSEEPFDINLLLKSLSNWSQTLKFGIDYRMIEERTHIFKFSFPDEELKVDFAYYPYKRVEKGKVKDGVMIDSALDIAINKLSSVIQRMEVKDFVDLYFLMKNLSLWDLIHGLETKFKMEFDPLFLSADFLKVEKFEFLPRMILPLSLPELKAFFKEKAKDLAGTVIEK